MATPFQEYDIMHLVKPWDSKVEPEDVLDNYRAFNMKLLHLRRALETLAQDLEDTVTTIA